MGQRCTRTEFEWTTQEEPHAIRRKKILEEYPQIKRLFGYDPKLKWIVTMMVLTQFAMLFIVKDLPWYAWLPLAYLWGGSINHSLELAIHEISHNLAFGHARPLANRLIGMFANLPVGMPIAVSFKRYHLEHHRYQGDEKIDTDIPTYAEAKLFNTTFGKCIWVLFQPFFYAFRPLFTYPKTPCGWEIVNAAIQLTFNGIVMYFFGYHSWLYLFIGSVLAMGMHPMAGHFVSEHYMFKKGYETYSYYGPLNWVMFNVGFHNEHHDFPAVPGSKLAEIRRIAKEHYDTLPHYDSLSGVLHDFVNDPDVGPYARIKRRNLGLRG